MKTKLATALALTAGVVFSATAQSPTYLPNSFYDRMNQRMEQMQEDMEAFDPESIPSTFDDLTDGTTNKAFTATSLTKLNGIAAGATVNSPDATLLNRANHTGTQAASTISNFTAAARSVISASNGISYVSSTGLIEPTYGTSASTVMQGNVGSLKANFAALSVRAAHGIANGATNAPTDAPTNLNALSTLLGALVGEVNATNQRQNDIAAKYNDLAGKFNTLLVRHNELISSTNALRTAGSQ